MLGDYVKGFHPLKKWYLNLKEEKNIVISGPLSPTGCTFTAWMATRCRLPAVLVLVKLWPLLAHSQVYGGRGLLPSAFQPPSCFGISSCPCLVSSCSDPHELLAFRETSQSWGTIRASKKWFGSRCKWRFSSALEEEVVWLVNRQKQHILNTPVCWNCPCWEGLWLGTRAGDGLFGLPWESRDPGCSVMPHVSALWAPEAWPQMFQASLPLQPSPFEQLQKPPCSTLCCLCTPAILGQALSCFSSCLPDNLSVSLAAIKLMWFERNIL